MKKRILGKQTGCDIDKDGGYRIAPVYIDIFNALQERQIGSDRLIESITRHCAAINTEIEKERTKLWKQLQDDLGLDPTKKWLYQNGVIFERKEEKK